VKVRGPGARPTEQADRATIEVRVHEVGQLFNSLDPSPLAERDLDDDAEAYLIGWAREVGIAENEPRSGALWSASW
jgi:hypothetical protein